MSGHFFGARTVNERRRRRLALEALSARPFPPASTDRDLPVVGDAAGLVPERTRLITRINSLIRPEPWFAWLIIGAFTGLGIGLLVAGRAIDQSRPELASILGLSAGHTTRFFAALVLLCVSQLSCIILWYRTHSRKDFHGRYRVWIWSSLVWPVFSAATLFNGHHALTARVATFAPEFAAAIGTSLWSFPAAIIFLTMLRLLSKDMSSHRLSRGLLKSSGVAAGACLLATVFNYPWAGVTQPLVANGLKILWTVLLMAAFLHHARYVIHVSNEVLLLKKRKSRWSPILSEGWQELCLMLPSRERLAKRMEPRQLAAGAGWLLRGMLLALKLLWSAVRNTTQGTRGLIAHWRKARKQKPGRRRANATPHMAGLLTATPSEKELPERQPRVKSSQSSGPPAGKGKRSTAAPSNQKTAS